MGFLVLDGFLLNFFHAPLLRFKVLPCFAETQPLIQWWWFNFFCRLWIWWAWPGLTNFEAAILSLPWSKVWWWATRQALIRGPFLLRGGGCECQRSRLYAPTCGFQLSMPIRSP